jgi:hypothetical protein
MGPSPPPSPPSAAKDLFPGNPKTLLGRRELVVRDTSRRWRNNPFSPYLVIASVSRREERLM